MLTMTSPMPGSGPVRCDSSESRDALRVEVGDLLHTTGVRRRIETEASLSDLEVTGSVVEDPVRLDLWLDAIPEGIVASGTVRAEWSGECSRCLEAVEGPLELEVHELFEAEPVESETYPLEGDEIDLEPLVRDAVVLEIPEVPLCDEECRGLCPACGIDRNVGDCDCGETAPDPRWSALDELEFPDS